MVDALRLNVLAVHVCNWEEYVSSLRVMLSWTVAYDNNRYGRWLPDFWAVLTALLVDQAVVNQVEVSHLVDLPQLLEHRVVEVCISLLNSNGTHRKTQKASSSRSSLCNM